MKKAVKAGGGRKHFGCSSGAGSSAGGFRRSLLALDIVLVLAVAAAFAGSSIPRLIDFQGKLTNSTGGLVNAPVNLVFNIYDAETGGVALWSETHSNVQVSNGTFRVLLGNVTPLNLAFDRPYWLGLTVGSDTEMTPRLQLASSGYAFTAEGAVNFSVSGFLRVGTAVPSAERLSVWGLSNSVNEPIMRVASNGSQAPLYLTANASGVAGNAYVKGDDAGGLALGAQGSVVIEAGGFGSWYEKMRVTSGGNVGIGTTTPAAKLEVKDGNDRILIYGGATTPRIQLFEGDATGKTFIIINQGNYATLGHANHENSVTILEAGNVGIGTTTPGSRLEVFDSYFPSIQLTSSSTTAAAIDISNTAGGREWRIQSTGSATNRAGQFEIVDMNADGTPSRLAINTDGNVGIGTTSPTTRLHVAGTARVDGGAVIMPLASPSAPTVVPSGTGTSTWGYRITALSATGETLPSPETNVSNGPVALASPVPYINVSWTAVAGAVKYKVYRTTAPSLTTTGFLSNVTSTFYQDFGSLATGSLPIIDTSGNIGIGTTTPTAKLHISGVAGVDGIRFPDDTLMTTAAAKGTVANVVVVQTREQGLYAAPVSGNGTVVTPLSLVIKPKKAGNMIILEWIVNGEMHHDTVYIVTRNGVLLENTTDGANNRWAGITAQPYNVDAASTPDNAVVKIIDMNSLAEETTYELRVRSSSATAYTLYLNRPVGSAGADAYEASLSTGIATEIWR